MARGGPRDFSLPRTRQDRFAASWAPALLPPHPHASPQPFSPPTERHPFLARKTLFYAKTRRKGWHGRDFPPAEQGPLLTAQPRAPEEPRQRGPGAGVPATERPRRDLRRPALRGGERAPPPTARAPAAAAPQRPPPALRMRPPARPGPAPAGSSARPACARGGKGALLPPAGEPSPQPQPTRRRGRACSSELAGARLCPQLRECAPRRCVPQRTEGRRPVRAGPGAEARRKRQQGGSCADDGLPAPLARAPPTALVPGFRIQRVGSFPVLIRE